MTDLYDRFRPRVVRMLERFGAPATLTRTVVTSPTREQKIAGVATSTISNFIPTRAVKTTDEQSVSLSVTGATGTAIVREEPHVGDILTIGQSSNRVLEVLPMDPQGRAFGWEVVLA